MPNFQAGYSNVLLSIVGIIWYHQVWQWLKKHLDDPVPNGEFPALHCLGI
jgi:hypothetical protein